MVTLLFSYGVYVSNANYIDGEFGEDFLETKELTSDDLEGLDEDAQNELAVEYDDFVLARLRGQLQENSESLGLHGELKEGRFGYELGFLFQAGGSLAALDHIFRKISETTQDLFVDDFTSKLVQSYFEGENDSGSLPEPSEEYVERINSRLAELEQMGFVLEVLDLAQVPVWRIFGECMLRFKNDLLPVEGIEVVFDGHAHDEDDYEIAILDKESYVIGVTLPDCSRVPSFFGYLNDCQTVPTVDWDYVQELYERDVEEQLQDSRSDMTVAEFEEHVRELFRNSLTAHLSESDDDEEDDD